MILEIGYTYQVDKSSPAHTSWTYFYVKSDDLATAKKKAKTYWNKFIKELGWTKQTKLTHIEAILNEKTYTPDFIVVSSAELPNARRRSTRGTRKTPTRRTRKKA